MRKRLTLYKKATVYLIILDAGLQLKTPAAFIDLVYKTVDQCVYRECKRRQITPVQRTPDADAAVNIRVQHLHNNLRRESRLCGMLPNDYEVLSVS